MLRLHLGCGPHHIDGWINIDSVPYPGVDQVLDVSRGLPFEDVSFIFAEHFIEHLHYRDATALLRECRRALRDDGVLRLSTPNLDWVWASHYRRVMPEDQQVLASFAINRAFRGWGHQFLYNWGTLAATLRAAGFAEVARQKYGESQHPELRGIERHEQTPDYDSLSHILIVEAWGRGGEPPAVLSEHAAWYLRDVDVK
ncbi:MAG TPA: methyltransferase domain-containing protein [Thermoanaerobaculia bacterium]|nr:methyltransferase domain-containing protein [Thermoanaerobaculia bacterium]